LLQDFLQQGQLTVHGLVQPVLQVLDAVTERGGTWDLTSGEQGGAELTMELPGTGWSSDASHGGS
jgi:hypothetical protein